MNCGEFAAAIGGGAVAAGSDEVVVAAEELAVWRRGLTDSAGELIARGGEAVGRGEGVQLGFEKFEFACRGFGEAMGWRMWRRRDFTTESTESTERTGGNVARRMWGDSGLAGVGNRRGGLNLGVGAGVEVGGVDGVAARDGGEGHFVDPVERKGGGVEVGIYSNRSRTCLQARIRKFLQVF